MTLAVKALHHHKHFPAQTLKGLSQKNVVAVLEGNYSVISVHGGMSVMVARRGRNIKEVGGMAWLSASGRMFFWVCPACPVWGTVVTIQSILLFRLFRFRPVYHFLLGVRVCSLWLVVLSVLRVAISLMSRAPHGSFSLSLAYCSLPYPSWPSLA